MENAIGAKNFVVILFGKRYIIKLHQLINVRGIQYIFLGAFNNDEEVPNVTCCYIVENLMKTKLVQRPQISNKKLVINNENDGADDSVSDSQLLKIVIDKEDDELMVLMKTILMKKRVTVGQFKRLYGENNKTDMNNDKSRIENKNTLSWNKFKFILEKLNIEYSIYIFDNE